MSKIIIYSILLLTTQCFAQEFSDSDKSSQFMCGSSSINKCNCRQETNDILNIPLFIIDCSRLELKVSPAQTVLPVLMSSLDLSHNKIEFLSGDIQLNSTTLQHLDYSYNQIQNISTRYFENLKNLISLNLAYNNLKNLDNNQINLNHLKILNLASNNITYIPDNYFDNLHQLQDLDLSKNNLGYFFFDIKKQILPLSLISLRLNDINLRNTTDVTFSELKNIKLFTIINNPIEEMMTLPFEALEYLDISETNITRIEENHLNYSSLKELKMERLPRLKKIGDFAFGNMKNLEVLTIEQCDELVLFESFVFGFLNLNTVKEFKLKKISLAANNISTLDGSFEYLFKNLEEVKLNENPWHCGCELTWLTHLTNVENINDTRCYSPPQLKFKTVTKLTPKEFVCMENRNIHISVGVPTHRWLFPMIGILSVIVLILIGVLMYLGPFGSSVQWTRSIGPDSPYNRITIESAEDTSRQL